MTAPTNLSFELQGSSSELNVLTPGDPYAWTTNVTATGFDVAAFLVVAATMSALAIYAPAEEFELLWGADGYLFGSMNVVAAMFGALPFIDQPFEDFERSWSGDENYLSELDLLIEASVDGDFEDNWSNNGYLSDLPGSLPEIDEDFESGWGPSSYILAFVVGTDTTNAVFSGTFSDDRETFEHAFISKSPATGDATTNRITFAAHGLTGGAVVRFVPAAGAQLPTPLLRNVDYSVNAATTNDFEVFLTSGGPTIDLLDNGTGTFAIVGSPTLYWNDPITSW